MTIHKPYLAYKTQLVKSKNVQSFCPKYKQINKLPPKIFVNWILLQHLSFPIMDLAFTHTVIKHLLSHSIPYCMHSCHLLATLSLSLHTQHVAVCFYLCYSLSQLLYTVHISCTLYNRNNLLYKGTFLTM